jgi:hypothetical protein
LELPRAHKLGFQSFSLGHKGSNFKAETKVNEESDEGK